MKDELIGIGALVLGICGILFVVFRRPKSEFPGLPTFQGIMGGIICIVVGILLIIGKIKL